ENQLSLVIKKKQKDIPLNQTTLSFSFHVKFDANKDALAEQNRLYGSLPQCLASFSARLKSNFSSSSVPSASSFHLLLNSTLSWAGTPTSVSSPFRGGYTVLINTWKRKSLLKNSVAHCSSCGGSDAIRVLWSETHPPSEAEFQKNGVANYKYGGWWTVRWMGSYSMVLSKAAFYHKKLSYRNCEDIAMSSLVADATAAPPNLG
ncbi:hypothetical protein QUC31_008048, partial [Theobroma cacao]